MGNFFFGYTHGQGVLNSVELQIGIFQTRKGNIIGPVVGDLRYNFSGSRPETARVTLSECSLGRRALTRR